jgi:hypothetical protein
MQDILRAFRGPAVVVLEIERSGGGVRRIPTSLQVAPSEELEGRLLDELGDVITFINSPPRPCDLNQLR